MERWSTQWHTNGSLSDRQRELPQLTDTATTARCSEYRSTDERGGSCGFCKYVQSLDTRVDVDSVHGRTERALERKLMLVHDTSLLHAAHIFVIE